MNTLNKYGFTKDMERNITREDKEKGYIPARITAIHKESFELISEYGESHGKLKSSIFYHNSDLAAYPTVGDFVLIQYNPHGDNTIYKVLPRKSFFSRVNPSNRLSTKMVSTQMISANFDYVFIMTSLNNDFSINRIQRYLTTAYSSGGTPVIILTKADLCDDPSIYYHKIKELYPDLDVCIISAETKYGLESLSKYLQEFSTIVFLGSSGIGKSTLVNSLLGFHKMATKEIMKEDSRGRHTTTHRQMIFLENGSMLIDTPGMREFSIGDVDEGLSETFYDYDSLAKQCRFANCKHKNEPGCRILQGLIDGIITQEDIESYGKLQQEVKRAAFKTRMVAKRADKGEKTRNKEKRVQEKIKSQYDF